MFAAGPILFGTILEPMPPPGLPRSEHTIGQLENPP